jgi:hypothetical protein
MGRTTCYVATEVKPVIHHDETRNPSELSKHPDREEIQVSAGKEFDQIIEQDIGVEVTPAEVREITEKGIRILQCNLRSSSGRIPVSHVPGRSVLGVCRVLGVMSGLTKEQAELESLARLMVLPCIMTARPWCAGSRTSKSEQVRLLRRSAVKDHITSSCIGKVEAEPD